MKTPIILLFCLVSTITSAQFTFNYTSVDTIACTHDPSIDVLAYTNWDIYQTDDDTWNGVDLNSSCISLKKNETNAQHGIDLTSIDITKSLFVRFKVENLPLPLVYNTNSVYEISGGLNSGFNVNNDSDCPNNICSGLITILTLSENGETGQRRGDFNFTEQGQYFYSCFVTENVEINQMEDIIYKLTFDSDTDVDQPLFLQSIYFQWSYDTPNLIGSGLAVPESYYDGSSYNFSIQDFTTSYSSNWIVLNTQGGIPNNNTPSIAEVYPESDPAESRIINMEIEQWANLYFQSFTQLKGGLVAGSDTLRHELNIINNSLELCLFIVEFIGEDGTNFIHNGGDIHMASPNSCLQFRNNSSLIIGHDNDLHLGAQGSGILYLRSGSTVKFREGSSLYFDGQLIVNTFGDHTSDHDIYIDLPPNSSLAFSPFAKIIISSNDITLNIRMLGGNLDISQLSYDDQQKINIIYPDQSRLTERFTITPNPAQDQVITFFNNQEKGDLIIINSSGRTVKSIPIDYTDSAAQVIDLDGLSSGSYVIMVKSKSGLDYQKLIIQN